MKPSPPLSTFDRIGVAVVAPLGACLGWEISTANDIVLTPTLALFFPGPVVGFALSRFAGRNIVGIVSGVANGAIYGLVLYGWNRIANRISGLDRRRGALKSAGFIVLSPLISHHHKIRKWAVCRLPIRPLHAFWADWGGQVRRQFLRLAQIVVAVPSLPRQPD
jgi:hypothetical protein